MMLEKLAATQVVSANVGAAKNTLLNINDLLEARVGIEPSSPLQTRKLFILRSDKKYKNARNAKVRYTPGTRTS